MNELLTKVLDAHGGLERWRSYNKVEATIVGHLVNGVPIRVSKFEHVVR